MTGCFAGERYTSLARCHHNTRLSSHPRCGRSRSDVRKQIIRGAATGPARWGARGCQALATGACDAESRGGDTATARRSERRSLKTHTLSNLIHHRGPLAPRGVISCGSIMPRASAGCQAQGCRGRFRWMTPAGRGIRARAGDGPVALLCSLRDPVPLTACPCPR